MHWGSERLYVSIVFLGIFKSGFSCFVPLGDALCFVFFCTCFLCFFPYLFTFLHLMACSLVVSCMCLWEMMNASLVRVYEKP